MGFICCVKGCRTTGTNGLHSFPANKSIAVKWIMAIKADHLMEKLNQNKLARSYEKVCNKHFTEADFQSNKTHLVQNSIPSLFLPGDTVVRSQQ